jgi:type II secretory pathway component PulF
VPQFIYRAKSAPGKIREDTMTAESSTAVIKKLRQQGWYPISVTESTVSLRRSSAGRINAKDITEFTRQLANLVHAGFSLPNALSTLRQQVTEQKITRFIDDLTDKVRKGSSFSEALAASAADFGAFYINIIRIGESSGRLDEALLRLADFRERDREINARVRAALAYPVFILITGIGTVFFMVTFFVPRLVVLFTDIGQDLPLLTRIVMSVSSALSRWWLVLLLLCGGVGAFLHFNARTIRPFADKTLLSIPVLKDIIRKMEIARFTYGLSMLLKNGVPMLNAVEVVALNTSNCVFRQAISGFTERIQRGASLSECMRLNRLFPPAVINMAAVGEESGELTQLFERTAQTFESEINRSINTLVSLLEPALILLVGGVVMILVFAMLMPVFQMNIFVR